jgi:hypothetical protein
LPAVYLFLMVLWSVAFLLTAAHGTNPFQFALYLIYPARFLLDWLPASIGPKNFFLVFLSYMFLGLSQWILIGYLMDKLLAHFRKSNLAKEG